MLRIVTYNIHFGKQLTDIIPWINKQKTADVICLQEFPKIHLAGLYQSLHSDWGHRFTNSFIFRKKIFVLVTLFRKDKLHLTRKETLLMGIHPMEKTFLKNPMEKSCLITTFRAGTKTLTIANTHLVYLAANRSRYNQIRLIASELLTDRHTAIITGDFNLHSTKINNKLVEFMREFGFHTIEKRMATHHVGLMKHQLDYTFGLKCKILKLEAARVRFSDHYPVIAEVNL